jgi:thioredoxin-related protein
MKTSQFFATLALLAFSACGGFAKSGWEDDFDKGLAKASSDKKIALVDFTGSDWCSWCMKLDAEVFSQKEFKEYAKANLVLVEVDFPQITPLPQRKQEKHEGLAKKYDVTGFPSVLVFDPAGKELGRLGYTEGGPRAFIAQLEKITKK